MAITLTENAAKHIKQTIAKQGKGLGLRLGVKTTGCSGLAYTFDLAEEVKEDDCLFEGFNARVVIDPKSLRYLDGSVLDYAREGLNEGFRFNNPNVKSQCGCGESFSV